MITNSTPSRPRLVRRLLRIVLIIMILGGLLWSSLALFVYVYGQADHAAPADVIIILGGGTLPDGAASPDTTRRVLRGVALYQQGIAPLLMCTGGQLRNRPNSEAQACQILAEAKGIPASAILLEATSTSTEENAIEARKVMDANHLKNAVLVSDNFHLFRAELMFHQQNIAIVTSPAQITTGPLDLESAVYDSYREGAAVVWYVFKSALNLPITSLKNK